jgi:hypothetical protein
VLWTLLASGAASLVAASVFGWTGAWFLDRARGSPEAAALRSFAVWWLGIGAYTAIRGTEDTLGALGAATMAVYVPLRYASLPILCLGLAGLAYYATYLRTGRRGWLWPIAIYYATLAAAFVTTITINGPTGIDVQRWRTDLTYATPIAGPLLSAILALIIAPLAAAAIGMLSLARKLPAGPARRRIAIVGASLLVYLLAAMLSRAAQSDFGQLLARPLLGLVVAGAVVVAYHPGRPPAASRSAERALSLQQRVRELV